MKKSCKICGKEFEAVANAGYCSDACRRKARAAREEIRKQKRRAAKNYTRTCLICGKEFESMRGEKYCSDRCRVQGQSKPKKKVPKICPVCGKEFFSSYTRHKYCSDECREKQNKLAIGLQPPQKKICPICGNSFLARTRNVLYCSKACYRVAQGQTNTKPNPPKARKKPKETLYDITRELAISGESYGKRQARLREMRSGK